jgi:hypothetical protein
MKIGWLVVAAVGFIGFLATIVLVPDSTATGIGTPGERTALPLIGPTSETHEAVLAMSPTVALILGGLYLRPVYKRHDEKHRSQREELSEVRLIHRSSP